MQTIFIVILGLIGGVAIGLQTPLASLMSQRLGILESVFIIHLGGTLVALLLLFFKPDGNLNNWRSVPFYALGAGVLGMILISILSFMVPRIGVASSIMIVVAGQLMIGAILDHFGLLGLEARPTSLMRLIGFFVVFVGVWLTLPR